LYRVLTDNVDAETYTTAYSGAHPSLYLVAHPTWFTYVKASQSPSVSDIACIFLSRMGYFKGFVRSQRRLVVTECLGQYPCQRCSIASKHYSVASRSCRSRGSESWLSHWLRHSFPSWRHRGCSFPSITRRYSFLSRSRMEHFPTSRNLSWLWSTFRPSQLAAQTTETALAPRCTVFIPTPVCWRWAYCYASSTIVSVNESHFLPILSICCCLGRPENVISPKTQINSPV